MVLTRTLPPRLRNSSACGAAAPPRPPPIVTRIVIVPSNDCALTMPGTMLDATAPTSMHSTWVFMRMLT